MESNEPTLIGTEIDKSNAKEWFDKNSRSFPEEYYRNKMLLGERRKSELLEMIKTFQMQRKLVLKRKSLYREIIDLIKDRINANLF